ncbi:MAG: uL15 family ribosomal protein [Candidatus Harrisonbacteria bacterium]|nr:uL15 family ribosomal protein [Candidatus Harrisonbacteria bacterium]
MNLFENSKQKNKRSQRVARGGKRGTTAGRGTKGQKSRSGHRIRPAIRDLLIRLPKLRGYKNKSFNKRPHVLNLDDLQKNPENIFSRKDFGNVKILGAGKLKKAVTIQGLAVSKSAKEKIEKAGGTVK